jgi:hypothetical protein
MPAGLPSPEMRRYRGLMKAMLTGLAAIGAFALGACDEGAPKAPWDKGVCWHMVRNKDGTVKFNKLAVNQPSLEYCAARLELMRRSFLSLGGPRAEVVGAFQGRFIFVERRGIFSGKRLNGSRFLTLQRTADGRLAIPGAFQQPGAPIEQ